jgi:hypothetical protein
MNNASMCMVHQMNPVDEEDIFSNVESEDAVDDEPLE